MKSALFGPQRGSAYFKKSILIIDRIGLIGKPLALKVSEEFLVVFVSQKNQSLIKENKNIVYVPFLKKIPRIPDGKYSHIVFIDEEYEESELLSIIIRKAKDINANLIFAQGLSAKGKYAIDRVLHLYHSAKVVIFGDVFDNEIILKRKIFNSTINKYLYQAQRFGRIQVPGIGMKEIYPVYLGDIVNGLMDIIYGVHKSNSLFFIFPKYPSSELSVVHMIQKINPEVTVDFIKRDSKIEIMKIPPNGLNLLGEKYPLAQKIRSIDMKKKVSVESEVARGTVGKFEKFTSFMVWILILLLFLPFVFTNIFSFLGKSMFNYARGEMDRENFVNAQSSLHWSKIFFNLEKQAGYILFLQTKIIKKDDYFKDLLADADVNDKISESLSNVFDSEEYLSEILNGQSKDPNNDLTKSVNTLRSSLIGLEKLKAEKQIPKPILQNIETVIPIIEQVSSSASALSDTLGIKNEKAKTQSIAIMELKRQIWEIIKLIRL